jgi:hypothetical protein
MATLTNLLPGKGETGSLGVDGRLRSWVAGLDERSR